MGFKIIDLLLPRETKFFDYLEELGAHILNSSTAFRDLVVQIEGLSDEEIKKRLYAIRDYEVKGDVVEMTIIDELSRCFITPLDREDIHLLAINMDKPLDVLKGISRKMEIYHIHHMPLNACKFADIIVSIAKLQYELICDLRTKQKVKKKLEAMHRLENQADELFQDSLAELFGKNGNECPTIDTIKAKELYEMLEAVVDSIDYIGKLVRGIKIKHG